MSTHKGWIGVDLDGTLALYGEWQGFAHIGEPVPLMAARVAVWLDAGHDVRIFTARVGPGKTPEDTQASKDAIDAWTLKHFGQTLPVTATKDFNMVQLWDDRAVQVISNTGLRVDGHP